MSIPFFSIDFKRVDWSAYLKGTLGINFEKSIDKLISKRFPGKKFLKFSSSRMGFYFYLEQNFKSGDEIIFSSMSFPLYIKMAIQLGLKPVLVDVENRHLTINPELIVQSITGKTKAVVITHLFGHPGYLTEIANNMNVDSLTICGYDGGRLKQISNDSVWVRSYDMQICEDAHIVFGHLVMKSICNTEINTN